MGEESDRSFHSPEFANAGCTGNEARAGRPTSQPQSSGAGALWAGSVPLEDAASIKSFVCLISRD